MRQKARLRCYKFQYLVLRDCQYFIPVLLRPSNSIQNLRQKNLEASMSSLPPAVTENAGNNKTLEIIIGKAFLAAQQTCTSPWVLSKTYLKIPSAN